jgi:hypothetical protein
MSHLLSEAQLAAATGHVRPDGTVDRGQLKRCLRRARVPYRLGAGGQLWTTAAAIDAALGVGQAPAGAAGDADAYPPGLFGVGG